MNVKPSQTDLLARLLDASALRHRVISQNVANIDTPGYERLEVAFEDDLFAALADGNASSVQPRVVPSPEGQERADGNTVSIDEEMGDLSKNTLLYQTVAQLLTTRLGTLRAAVAGR